MAAHDVFISYSSLDKTTADAVCHGLEAQGVRCWIAPRDVTPGMEWQQSLLDAIAASRAVVLVFTGNANDSTHVRKEITAAMESRRIVIPFRLEEVEPVGSLRWDLTGVHWLDALSPPLEAHVRELASTVKRIVGRDAERADPVAAEPEPVAIVLPPPPPPERPPELEQARQIHGLVGGVAANGPTKRPPWILLGAGGAAVLAVVLGVIWITTTISHVAQTLNRAQILTSGSGPVVSNTATGVTPPTPPAALTAGQAAAAQMLRTTPANVQEYGSEFQQIQNGPPTSLADVPVISTQQLAVSLSQHLVDVTLIDALGCGEHLSLPTARCVSLTEDSVALLTQAGVSRAAPLVVFCDGPGCPNSYLEARTLHQAGFTNVFWYRGGLQAWSAANGPTAPPTPLDPAAPPVPETPAPPPEQPTDQPVEQQQADQPAA